MKEVKEMKSELKTVQERIGEIAPEKERIRERLDVAKQKHSQIESQISDLRNERQDILVVEGDLDNVNVRLKETRKLEEILEDEIEGLSRKFSSLEAEEPRLADQAKELRKEIFKEETLRPLIAEYNRLAPELAEVLKRFAAAADTYIRTFNSPAHRIFLDQGINAGPRSLPGMWLPGDEPVPEYYNRGIEAERLVARARVEQIKNTYPDCRCFKCASLAGVEADLTVRCSRLGDQVPREILNGLNPSQGTRAYIMCVFTPVS